jgi:molecular chaperone GrpE
MLRKKHAKKEETHSEQQRAMETEQQDLMGEEAADGAARHGDPPAAGEVERLRSEAAEWKDRALRALADMENVRRRARQEAEDARRYASQSLVEELLPVLDNLNRALEHAEQNPDPEALCSGVELIRRQLTEVLEKAGLARIEAVGQPFDPNLHEAIMQVEPQEGQAPHEVVEELRAGYRMKDRVVRPSLVKVTSG